MSVQQMQQLELFPRESLDSLFAALPDHDKQVPNFNTAFRVNGLAEEDVRWLVEAEHRASDDPVILFAHGGAYVYGMTPAFAVFMAQVYARLHNPRLSILYVNYTLAADAPCPRQLEEFTLVFNALAQTSSNVIILGDSAGGHLALTLHRHIAVPYPHVTRAVNGAAGHIAASILLSPWLDMYPEEKGTYLTNKEADYLDRSVLLRSTELFFNGEQQLYTAPEWNPLFDVIDWKGVLPRRTMVNVGDREIFLNDIITWVRKAAVEEYTIDPGFAHDSGFVVPMESPVIQRVVDFIQSL